MTDLSANVNVNVVQKTELDRLRAELDELRKEWDTHEHHPKGYVADLLKKLEDTNQLCIEAAIAMNNQKVSRHVQFVNWEDVVIGDTGMARTGWYPEKLMKVTIEWVDESEADPKNFESGITRRAVDGASCSCPVNSAGTTLICQQCGLPVSPRN